MNKIIKLIIIIGIIIVLFISIFVISTVIFAISSVADTDEIAIMLTEAKCNWRLSDIPAETCSAIFTGVYFNGEKCVSDITGACKNYAPFGTLEECQQKCE
ncbi:MAG: hypothetical protein V1672_00950 [Candidatus Diapherotrites archaeon]